MSFSSSGSPNATTAVPGAGLASLPSGAGKGGTGGQPAQPMPAFPNQAQYAPMQQPSRPPPQPQYSSPQQSSAPNVYQQSSAALTGAQNTANRLSNFTPMGMQAATAGPAAMMTAAQLAEVERMKGVGAVQAAQAQGQIDVNQLSSTNLNPYMSPYTQSVIDAGQADIERQRQMASNTLGAQAQAANAYGGSRQGVQEGVLAGEALRQAGQLSAQQRQQGFNTALQSGQFDIGNVQQARTLSSGQEFQAEQLGQQAREAAANRDQAARAGNMQAANQFSIQQAQFEQQARSLNQSATNTFAQAQAARDQAANQSNFGGQFQAAGVQAGAAGQLGNLSQTGFGMGQQIQQNQMQQGLMQQGLQQQLIDAARGQYANAVNAPMQSLNAPLTALGAQPNQSTTTNSMNPGLFQYLQVAAQAMP
tara:strand:- start:310 stop:1569 length:1260 start_codon:yes stop_codon:yes gene_type:complete